jgi:predicted Zn-dependent protease
MPVEQRYALFLASMKAGDLAAAREQLAGLQSQIPPGTMTRLRAEAWFALQSGDEPTARRSYQDMLERLPGDEEAAINLASMEARAGQREKARQVLSDALAYNPGSETLLAALARFKAPARN